MALWYASFRISFQKNNTAHNPELSLGLFWSQCAFAQNRTVAVTVDDLPYASAGEVSPSDAAMAQQINRKLLAALKRHHTPVTGFVIQRGVEGLGVAAGTQILREWTGGEFDLGNHTYSHPYREQP
jgi:peptidoglycan/xylan/chitin deacetylase (PgdA/CDA1 family)